MKPKLIAILLVLVVVPLALLAWLGARVARDEHEIVQHEIRGLLTSQLRDTDAVVAKLMGFDPLGIRFIRLAHDMGLGCGDPSDIEIVGDVEAARENWHFEGPTENLTFAARMQHQIYWGALKRPIEWSLKTWMAPWSYVASVLYHDLYWYPVNGNQRVHEVLESEWGRLFHNWDRVLPDERGWPDVGKAPAEFVRGTGDLLRIGASVLGTAIREAPEVAARLRRRSST